MVAVFSGARCLRVIGNWEKGNWEKGNFLSAALGVLFLALRHAIAIDIDRALTGFEIGLYSRSPIEVERRKKEEVIIAIISAIKNVRRHRARLLYLIEAHQSNWFVVRTLVLTANR